MNLRIYARYQMNFKSSWMQPSAVLMGLSFYLRVFHYFGFTYISQWTFWDVVFQILLPLLLCGTFVVLIGAIKVNSPGIFAILGAGLCLHFAIWNLFGAGIVRVILGFVVYLLSGAVLLLTAGGYIPWKRLSSGLLLVPAVVRIFLIDVPAMGLGGLVLEGSVLCCMISLFCLTFCFDEVKQRA